MGLLTKLGKTVIKAADKAQDINKQMSLDLPEIIEDTPIKTSVVTDDLADEATEMLGNKEAIDNWKKENKVPKEESKRRKQRKFSEQAKDLQAGIMSGPEYRKYIRENQPATSFTPEDLKTMMPNFKQVVGALTKDKSDSGILGLNSSLDKGNIVSSRLDIPAYNEHDIWVTSIVDKEKGKLYGRTAVLKNVNFDMTNRGAKKLALDIATEAKKTKKVLDKETGERVPQEFTQTKTPFATMKGEWQDFSDKDAFALAEKYINDPEWIQVGFNPERHSFFYDKETMMPVFNADAVVQIGALVLAKVPKLTTPALRAERINKLRKLRIDNMPEGAKPATFKEGGLVPMDNQMNFALGGLNDEGGEIDEASGNRVPIGGTKEGVRDDIEINISEGEFVFPADVVRYHGLDKMMALRQEAKMGLKQMERMGQMGNSDEATMPDDLPFEMADLIVVGGKGEPMEFSEGGFVPSYTPKFETLEIADVPMMGGNTSTGTQTPLVYEDFIKLPVVTMQEYRDANGNSIIITYVNGVATTEIPEGYTLYTPPANTAPTTTQAAIQTVNINSYRPSGDSEGPEPQPDQPAPDYRNMNDNEFFSYMAEQNSFGAKAGNAAGLAIASMIGGPVGLLVSALMRNDKNNQMANMKSRIDRMPNGPAKTNALELYKEYGGETDPKKKQGLFANIANFVTGLVTPVANTLGINQQDAAKVAQNAAVTEVSGAEPATTAAAPTTSLKPMLRPERTPAGNIQTPTLPATVPFRKTLPLKGGPPKAASFPQRADPRRAIPTGRDINMTVEKPPSVPAAQIPYTTTAPISVPSSGADPVIPEATPATGQVPLAQAGALDDMIARAPIRTSAFDTSIPAVQVAGPISTASDPYLQKMADPYRDDVIIPQESKDYLDALNIDTSSPAKTKQMSDNYLRNRGDLVAPVYTGGGVERQDAANYLPTPAVTQQADPRDPYASDIVTRDVRTDLGAGTPSFIEGISTAPIITETDDGQKFISRINQTYDPQTAGIIGTDSVPSQTQQAFNVPQQFGDTSYIDPATPARQQFGDTSYIDPATPDYFRDEMEGFEKGDVTGFLETPAQARAREAAAQRARIQTRNKEIATATSKIPAYIANSKQTQDSIKAGYTGSTTGGYAIGKISGSDGNEAGVLQRADGKVTKLRDLKGYEGLKGTQRGAMTVFSDAEGTKFVKSTFGKKTKLNGDKYEGPGITRKDKGLGNTFFQSAANVITPSDGKSYVDGELVSDSGGSGSSSSSSSTKTYSSLAEAAKDGKHGQAVNIAGKGVQKVEFGDASYDAKMKAESDKADDGGSDDSKIVCTEMYRQTQLVDWQHTMKIWHVYQEKYLTPYHQIGYHWLFKPYVKGMKKSSMLTKLGATLAKHRTEHLRYVLTKGKSKDNLIGNVWCKFVHPLVYVAGIFKQKIGK
tara:strand:+ start:110 stop:4369 length:4260 start_codon:yes stop_codon:yes gene_type:complete